MKLFCCTFAGGNGSFFDGLEAYICPEIELVKLEYAGHTKRHHEAFYGDFEELALDMYRQIKSQITLNESYALFGYSMGAIAVAEVTKLILSMGELQLPVHMFLASHAPCAVWGGYNTDDADSDEVIQQWTIRFGGLPDKLINSRTFWRIYLPIYRADFKLIMFYDYSRLDYVTDIPATVLFSPEDIARSDMEKWHGIFNGEFNLEEYDGGHFFLRQHECEVAGVIMRRMKQYGV